MDKILSPDFPLALLAIPLVITTMIVALRANPPQQQRPMTQRLLAVIGFIGMAAALPLFRFVGVVAAMAVLLIGCFAFHGLVWLSRQGSETLESKTASEPDLLDLSEIDWSGFERSRAGWQQ